MISCLRNGVPPSSLRFHKARRIEADHNGFSYNNNNNNREEKNGFNGYASISEERRETRRKRVQVGWGGADGGRGNEWKRRRSLDFNWHFNKWNTALPIHLPPPLPPIALRSSTFPLFSLCTAAETIIEIGTFRPCMFRIPGVLPAETVID